MLAAPSHKDYDNFTVYSGPAAYQANAHIKRGVPPPVITYDSSSGPVRRLGTPLQLPSLNLRFSSTSSSKEACELRSKGQQHLATKRMHIRGCAPGCGPTLCT